MRDHSISRGPWYGVCLLVTVVLLGFLPGCNPTASTTSGSTDTPVSATDTPEGESLSQPDAAVRAILIAFQTGEAGDIWNSLPARHHAEINTLVRDFAAKMDPIIWKRLFVVARRIVDVLRSKQDLILGNPELKLPSVNKRLFSENWNELIAMLQLLVDSELSDLDKLRTFKGETFFQGTGTRFLKQLVALSAKDPNDPFRKGFDAAVRLIAIDGSDATIGLTTGSTFVMSRQAVDAKPQETQMKVRQVDGVWIVADLDFGLSKMYQDGRAMVDGIPDDAFRNNRGPLIKLLETVEEDLDRIELTKTGKELAQALVLAQLRIRQLVSAGTRAESETESANDSVPLGRTVTVVVKGEMDKATRQRVLERLENLKRPGEKSKVTDGEGLVRIIIPTDRFLQDVVDEIDFGSISDVDEVERRLTVTVQPKPKQKNRAKRDSPGK